MPLPTQNQATTMKTHNDTHQGEFPNLLRDESGAVMVEFVIVSPFLITIMMAVFYFGDVGRFLCATHQWAAVQTWRSVGRGDTGLSDSDDFGFTSYGGADGIDKAMMTLPLGQDMASGGSTGKGAATVIYLSGPGIPFKALDCPTDTYYRGKLFEPSQLGGPGGNITYKNKTYLTPLLGAINSFVGNTSGTGTTAPLTTLDAHYASKGSIINDPYSVFYGDDAINRIRRVDRYTTLRNPAYDAAYLAHTMISGGLNIIGDLPQIMSDAGISLGDGGLSLGLPGIFEQAQPFRKVDKRINEESHDVDGNVDFGRGLADKNKLQEVTGDNLWKLVQ